MQSLPSTHAFLRFKNLIKYGKIKKIINSQLLKKEFHKNLNEFTALNQQNYEKFSFQRGIVNENIKNLNCQAFRQFQKFKTYVLSEFLIFDLKSGLPTLCVEKQPKTTLFFT
ncbi:hypothetical protein BpHYR1_036120 [Brachionus plicatilis]|uniref:Uncharacterized protein n=1 Tax=Brachionus plicatilis TaxID=10195 RepID=A0A3M7S5Q6_BRAPC|nr:hypothetical protein BpHYR1_036120 [Brachionus plicatilis]